MKRNTCKSALARVKTRLPNPWSDTLFVFFSRPFFDRRMGQEINGEVMGDDYKGYIFRITGGNDK